ncbi:MAG: hypothetical protein IJE68_01750 [Clostridia bacterium]|nr:hypothetical protein [Clostridia bacterium]
MKKSILILFAIIIIVVIIIFVKYSSYKNEYNTILKEKAEIEEYTENEIYGIELGTLINKVIDKNAKNKVEKDNNDVFISNEQNSIQIEIYMQDNDTTYKMETFYNAGIGQFIQYYGNIKFRCSKIEYHKNTGKIKYLLFEQIVTS